MDRLDRARHRGSTAKRTVIRAASRWLVPASLLAGAVMSGALLAHAPSNALPGLSQPLAVATSWGTFGARLVAILFVALACAFAAYRIALRHPPALPSTLAAIALSLIAALAWRPVFSSDVYAYAAYGAMMLHGVNPYQHATIADPFVAAARWQWSGSLPVCVYGAAFVAFAAAMVGLTKTFGVAAVLYALRIAACGAFVVCAWLLARAGTPDDAARGRRAALFFGLNPVAVWTAAEGHNDVFAIAVVLAGVAVSRYSARLGSTIASAAGALKLPAIAAGFPLGLGGGITGALVALGASIPLAIAFASNIAPHGHYAPFASVQSLSPLLALATAIALVLRARHAATRIDRLGLLALIAWLAIPNPYPWYGLWLLPLAAWATDRRIATAALLITAAALLRYIPDAVALPGRPEAIALGAAAFLGYTPLFDRAIISGP